MKRAFMNIPTPLLLSGILSGIALIPPLSSALPSTSVALYAASTVPPSNQPNHSTPSTQSALPDGAVTSEEVKAGLLPQINLSSAKDVWISEGSSEWEKYAPQRNLDVQPAAPQILSPNGKRMARLLPPENGLPMIQISTNGGQSWSTPKPASERLRGLGHSTIVLPDGRLAVLFQTLRAFDPQNALPNPLPAREQTLRNLTAKDQTLPNQNLTADDSAPVREWTLWIGNFLDLENQTPGIYQLLLGPASDSASSASMEFLPDGALLARIPFAKETKILKISQAKFSALDWEMMQKVKFPIPEIVEGGKPTLTPPPEGAVVLFDGNDFAQFSNASNWKLGKDLFPNAEDADWMEAGKGSISTRQKFGSCRFHLEFATPSEAKGKGQSRGNSGIYFMNRYELQILDSWQNETYPQGQCGAIYTQNPPMKNVCLKPGEWQSYDVLFTAPKFDENGELVSPARFTVHQNGILIQDDFQALGRNYFLHRYLPHAEKESLLIQDHGNPVRFRNIWIQELD